MGLLHAQQVDAGTEEDNGYFFKRLGEVRFTKRGRAVVAAHLAVAATHGVVALADNSGNHVYLFAANTC